VIRAAVLAAGATVLAGIALREVSNELDAAWFVDALILGLGALFVGALAVELLSLELVRRTQVTAAREADAAPSPPVSVTATLADHEPEPERDPSREVEGNIRTLRIISAGYGIYGSRVSDAHVDVIPNPNTSVGESLFHANARAWRVAFGQMNGASYGGVSAASSNSSGRPEKKVMTIGDQTITIEEGRMTIGPGVETEQPEHLIDPEGPAHA
jgi:hypothetical protein